MLLIEFNPEKFKNRQKCAASMQFLKINLIPGIASYKRENWMQVIDHPIHGPVINDYIDRGVVRVVQNSKQDQSGIADMSLTKAIALVDETTDTELLKSFKVEAAGNTELTAAINEQIKKLQPKTEDSGNE